MKNLKGTLKRVLAVALAVGTVALVGCGSNDESANTGSGEEMTVGVIQFGSHPSLDNCYAGIEATLKASGKNITIDLQNGNFETTTTDSIAKNMASKNYDLIVGIATPAAISGFSATANTNIPVVFSAVSDPVEAGLMSDLNNPGVNITGTRDVLDLKGQLELIRAIQPDATKIGVLYTTSEANSVSSLNTLKELAPSYGFEIIEQGVQTSADIPQAAAALAPQVDLINNFTDNNVVSNLNVVLEHANNNNIPVYGSEVEQVKNGCIAAVGVDYVKLGNITGEMILDILDGADAKTMAVRQIEESSATANQEILNKFNLKVPETYTNIEYVTQ